jgi:hypothetical protein
MGNLLISAKKNPKFTSFVAIVLIALIVSLTFGLTYKSNKVQKDIQRYGNTNTGSYFLKSDNSGNLSLYDPATTAFSSKELNSTGNITASGNITSTGTLKGGSYTLEGNPGDALRINGSKNSVYTAVFNGLNVHEGGGLRVGKWAKAPADQICIGDTCITENDLKKIRDNNFPNGISTSYLTIDGRNAQYGQIGTIFGGREEAPYFKTVKNAKPFEKDNPNSTWYAYYPS